MEKYMMKNFLPRLTSECVRISVDDIHELERATRGQSENELWRMLRIDRRTASNKISFFDGKNNAACNYGHVHEELVKQNTVLMDNVVKMIENHTKQRVVTRQLDCGMFLSEIGLHCASPDGYFILDNGEMVTLEIKCPYTYRHCTLEELRNTFNNKAVYRVPNTALTVHRNGPLNVRMVKTHDHWRQMQSQMYVTKAVVGVYLVKFGKESHSYVIVERDECHIATERDEEMRAFKMYVRMNGRENKKYCMESHRWASFPSTSTTLAKAKALARFGYFYKNGVALCYFCRHMLELEAPTPTQDHCAKEGNVASVSCVRKDFFKFDDRYHSLRVLKRYSDEECKCLARNKIFADNNNSDTLSVSCCGLSQSDIEPGFDINSISAMLRHTIHCGQV